MRENEKFYGKVIVIGLQLMMILGVGGVAFLLLAGYLIEIIGWRAAYLYLAVIMFVLMFFISLFLIKERPEDIGQTPFGDSAQGGVEVQAVASDVAISEIKTSVVFWLLFIGLVAGGTTNGGLITFIPTYWQSQGMSPQLSAIYAGLISLIGGIGNLMAGRITEKRGAKFLVTYTAVAFVISVFILITAPIETFYILLSILLIGCAYPTSSTMVSAVTLSIFGTESYGEVIGPLTGAIQFGAMAIFPVLGLVFSRFGMATGFALLAVFSIVELILINLTFRLSNRYEYHKLINQY